MYEPRAMQCRFNVNINKSDCSQFTVFYFKPTYLGTVDEVWTGGVRGTPGDEVFEDLRLQTRRQQAAARWLQRCAWQLARVDQNV